MGTQTMGSRGSAGGGGAVSGGSGGTLDSKSHALTRQGSLYSLTLDEVQNQLGDLGKPLSSMNLDELLKSVWSAETTNQISVTGNNSFASASAPSLPRQTSLTLSRDLSKKTVDEVWRDIRQGHNGNNDRDRRINERQPTLGEITLEDFLVKAGVVAESSPGKKFASPTIVADHVLSQQNVPPQQTQWMPYQQNQQHNMMSVYIPGHPMQQAIPIGGNQIVEAVYPESQMSMSPSGLMGALSDTQTPGRKRASGDVVEKTVERRQKRMIKNRESAARSRARKQAYTHELENKVSRLEEENERLKRQKEVEKLLPSPPPEPKYQLRRTSSAGF